MTMRNLRHPGSLYRSPHGHADGLCRRLTGLRAGADHVQFGAKAR